MNSKYFVAVIILNYNKRKDLLECMESVYHQDYDGYEVIIVDNASTDGSADEVAEKFPDINIIKNHVNTGAIDGRNTGWLLAEKIFNYDFLLFLDNDTVISRNFISKMVALFSGNTKIGIACGKTYTDVGFKKIMSAGIRANLFNGSIYDRGSGKNDKGQFDQSGYIDACGAFGMMIRRNLFTEIGGFDKNFSPYGWEDVDLCLKAKNHGYLIYYNSEAVMIHKGTKLGRKPNPFYEKNKIKNYIYLLINNTNSFQKITCTLCLPFRATVLSMKLISRGNSKIILEHTKGFMIGINNIKLSAKLTNKSIG